MSRHRTFAAAILVSAVIAVGCRSAAAPPPPATHPAKGVLIDKAGKPLSGGMVELVSEDQVPKSARAQIGSDGSFSLFVIDATGKKYDGAQEGDYRVTYIPPMTSQQTESPVNLPTKVKIHAGDNRLDLKLP